MRIDYVYIEDFKNLKKFEIDLDENFMETVLLGQNATGKSNFIESLILIFKHLDLSTQNEFDYKIYYRVRSQNIRIDFTEGKYAIKVDDNSISISEFSRRKSELLPKYVFTYYSGSSNRLKEHFDQHQKRFYDKIIKPTFDETEIDNLRRLFYVQLVHSYFVLLAYFSFEVHEKDSIQFLRDVLGIEDLESILFILHKPIWKGKGDPRFWGASGLVQEFLERVWDLSIAPIYHKDRISLNFRKFTTQDRLYLYISSKNKLKELSGFYRSNTDFFKALESTYISDIIEEIKVKVKKRDIDGEIGFKELSEGEQQLLTVMGLLKFTKDEESLILLDEPDTHLNPLWKWKYLEYLKSVIPDKDSTQIILNTHDPLVIGSLRKEQVRMFSESRGIVSTKQPDVDPKGLGVAGILTSELFMMPTTLDTETQKILDERNLLLAKQQHEELSQTEKFRLNEIFSNLRDLGITQTYRDPIYQKFLAAISGREEFKTKAQYSAEDLNKQNEIAISILDELVKEEKE